jgi:hypothetical protein
LFVVVAAGRQHGALRIDLESADERPDVAAEQFAEHVGDAARVARRDRDVMDHDFELFVISQFT